MNRSRRAGRRHAFALVAVLALFTAACSDDSGREATEPTNGTGADATVGGDTAETTPVEAAPAGWEQVVPGGDCQCADGSEFSFFVREADPAKVMVYFQGGGACFDPTSCAFESGTYKVGIGAADDPSGGGGVLDLSDDRNPLKDWSMVYVPYCTGDLHLGDSSTEYSSDLTVHHKGHVNATAALDHTVATFPRVTELLVAGGSAGSAPAPLYAGVLSDSYPDADITVVADGSGAYVDNAGINAAIGALWNSTASVPDWPSTADVTAEAWSLPGLFIHAGQHDPDITMARFDFAYDETQRFFAQLTGMDPDDLISLIDQNEEQVEQAGVDLWSFTAAGDEHTILTRGDFYTHETEGVSLVNWLTQLLGGEPVEDVRCQDCAQP